MRLASALFCAVLGGFGALAPAGASLGESASMIPKEWLQQRTSVAEQEAEHPGITDDRVRSSPEAAKPFGFQHPQWEEFKAAMQPGDEIWTFSSSSESWEHLAGRGGLALMRNGAPVRIMITVMN